LERECRDEEGCEEPSHQHILRLNVGQSGYAQGDESHWMAAVVIMQVRWRGYTGGRSHLLAPTPGRSVGTQLSRIVASSLVGVWRSCGRSE
jgi:hypothetical protein